MEQMEYITDDARVCFRADESGYTLDVRELMLDGGEPYAHIMACVGQLAPGELFYVHAIFEPAPLIKKLGRQGFSVSAAHIGIDHWVVAVQKIET